MAHGSIAGVLVAFIVLRLCALRYQGACLLQKPAHLPLIRFRAHQCPGLLHKTGRQLFSGLRVPGQPGGGYCSVFMPEACLLVSAGVMQNHCHGPVVRGQVISAGMLAEILLHCLQDPESIIRHIQPRTVIGGGLIQPQDLVIVQIDRAVQHVQHAEERFRILIYRRVHQPAIEKLLGCRSGQAKACSHLVRQLKQSVKPDRVFRELPFGIRPLSRGQKHAVHGQHHTVRYLHCLRKPGPGTDVFLHQGMHIQPFPVALQPAGGFQAADQVKTRAVCQLPEQTGLDTRGTEQGKELHENSVLRGKMIDLHQPVQDFQQCPATDGLIMDVVDFLLGKPGQTDAGNHGLCGFQIQVASVDLARDQLGQQRMPVNGVQDCGKAGLVSGVMHVAVRVMREHLQKGRVLHFADGEGGK